MFDRTALDQAIAVRAGEVSPRELAETALARIAEVNPTVHAFVRVFERRARAEARAMEKRRKNENLPIFFGVPTAMKDTALTAGGRTQAGTRALKWLYTPFDGAIARAVRAGGFTILGKTATSELAILPVVETDLHPPCRNPWNPGHSAGGSSGGAAAAVASGVLRIAHAEDGGGSIRIPAAFCHVFGHKPSRGTVPHFHEAMDPVGMGLVNCVAHAVEDAAAMLDVLAGRAYDPRNPPPDTLLARSRVAPGRLRIRFATTSPFTPVEPAIAAGVHEVALALGALGHDVEEREMLDLAIEDVLPTFARIPAQVPVLREAWLQPATRWVRAAGREISAQTAVEVAMATTARILAWFGDADLWLTPTCPQLPPAVGAWKALDGEAAFRAAMPIGAFTAPFNVSGQPAASIPAGMTQERLPFGAQLVGRLGEDATVLAVCRQLEEARPWRHRVAMG
jgi:amidase